MSNSHATNVSNRADFEAARPPAEARLGRVAGAASLKHSEPVRVLVVGGSLSGTRALESLLAATPDAHPIRFTTAENAPAAASALGQGGIDAVVVFDDLSGRLVLRGLQEQSSDTPAICIVDKIRTGGDDGRGQQRWRAREQGAWSCLFRAELTGPLLEASILHVVEMRRVGLAMQSAPIDDDVPGVLTRAAFMNRLDAAVSRAAGDDSYRFTLVWLDASPLASVRKIDPSASRSFVDRLVAAARTQPVARLGDGEFAVLHEEVVDADDLLLIDAINRAAAQPLVGTDEPIYIDVAVGIARGRARDGSAEAALERARSRASGVVLPTGDAAEISSVAVAPPQVAALRLEHALRQGLDRGEFAVAYQPIVDLHKGRLRGFEALIRWNHPDGEQRTAADFIPTAERSELIIGIGYWVLEAAVRQMAQWEREFDLQGQVAMSVNLSPKQVTDPLLLERVRSLLMTTGLTPTALCFEMESKSVMESREEASALIVGLAELGARVWVEDFGQTDCDVDHLRGLPIAALKIDREIVARLDGTEMTSGRVKHIISACTAMKAEVIAEGVENELQVNVLRWLGCKTGQGYLHARPMPVGDAYAYLASRR